MKGGFQSVKIGSGSGRALGRIRVEKERRERRRVWGMGRVEMYRGGVESERPGGKFGRKGEIGQWSCTDERGLGVSLSPVKDSRVKQYQLQPILIARRLAFNRVGRAERNGHVGLENWG